MRGSTSSRRMPRTLHLSGKTQLTRASTPLRARVARHCRDGCSARCIRPVKRSSRVRPRPAPQRMSVSPDVPPAEIPESQTWKSNLSPFPGHVSGSGPCGSARETSPFRSADPAFPISHNFRTARNAFGARPLPLDNEPHATPREALTTGDNQRGRSRP